MRFSARGARLEAAASTSRFMIPRAPGHASETSSEVDAPLLPISPPSAMLLIRYRAIVFTRYFTQRDG